MTAVWRNWGRNQVASPVRVERPHDEDAVAAVVLRAADEDRTIRPVGAGHSFSDLAVTDDVLLDTTALAGAIAVDTATGRITVGAGTRIAQVSAVARSSGLALENLGDIDTQTIAGAIATGTHGTGLAFGPISSRVVGVRLVTASGRVLAVSETEHADLLPAVRIGLGVLGVVTAVTLQCVPAFALHAVEAPEPLEEALDGFAERAAAADHLEFYWFPYSDVALVKRNMRVGDAAVGPRRGRLRQWVEDDLIANGGLEVACRLSRALPAMLPAVNRFAARTVAEREFSDDSHAVFTSPRRVRFVESEWSIPLAALPATLHRIRHETEARRLPVSFPIEVRAAGADGSAWLSTAADRETAHISVHCYAGHVVQEYFELVQAACHEVGGRPHWGKRHGLGRDELRALHPRFDDFVAVRDRLDPTGRFASAATTRLLGAPSAAAENSLSSRSESPPRW